MNLANRIERLRKAMQVRKSIRCELCWNRPGHVLVDVPLVYVPDNGRDDRRPEQPAADGEIGDPCLKCGRRPRITEISKVVVYAPTGTSIDRPQKMLP